MVEYIKNSNFNINMPPIANIKLNVNPLSTFEILNEFAFGNLRNETFDKFEKSIESICKFGSKHWWTW